MITATYTRYVNDPTTSETYLHEHSGERVVIHGDLANFGVEYDREDVGPMYRGEFADGAIYPLFEDELSDWSAL